MGHGSVSESETATSSWDALPDHDPTTPAWPRSVPGSSPGVGLRAGHQDVSARYADGGQDVKRIASAFGHDVVNSIIAADRLPTCSTPASRRRGQPGPAVMRRSGKDRSVRSASDPAVWGCCAQSTTATGSAMLTACTRLGVGTAAPSMRTGIRRSASAAASASSPSVCCSPATHANNTGNAADSVSGRGTRCSAAVIAQDNTCSASMPSSARHSLSMTVNA